MTPNAARGRLIVLGVIAAMLLTSITVIAFFVLLRGTDRLPFQLIRFGFTCLIAVFLFKRVPAARYLAILLFGISTVASLLSGILPMLPLAVLHGSIALTLAFSPSVQAYFRKGPPAA